MVREYRPEDYAEIVAWHEARGLSAPPVEALPQLGCISPGVAAGFLYQTDSIIAVLDVYISNPAAPPEVRDTALDIITLKLLNKARHLGFKYVKCETKLTSIGARASRLGFADTGTYRCLVKEL